MELHLLGFHRPVIGGVSSLIYLDLIVVFLLEDVVVLAKGVVSALGVASVLGVVSTPLGVSLALSSFSSFTPA